MPRKIQEDKYHRTFDQLKVTYELEKNLANQLKAATEEERKELYISLYDEFFQKIPDHPMLIRKADPTAIAWVVAQRMQLLKQFLYPDATFLEIGPGDCSLSIEIAKHVKKVYAVDVSYEVAQQSNVPNNFELVISDGSSIPVPENSVDIAYSHQLMEHLHPDDAFKQLRNVCRVLKPGGVYICITPNRLSGPHDTSQYFDEIATGWHLKEYTVNELYNLFCKAGFAQVDYYKSRGETHLVVPLNTMTTLPLRLIENSLNFLPFPLKIRVAEILTFRGITMVGTK